MHNENKSLEPHFALCVLATFEGNQLASRAVIEPGTAVTMDPYVIYTLNIDLTTLFGDPVQLTFDMEKKHQICNLLY